MIASYNYEKSSVNAEQLIGEIRTSSITIALDSIENTGTTISVKFKAELNDQELEILDEIVENHIGQPQGVFVGEVIVKEDHSMSFDKHTGKLITKDEPYNGPLYVTCVRFNTGVGELLEGADENWNIETDESGTKTIVTYKPAFNYQIDACGFKLLQNKPESETVVEKVCIAPGTPVEHIFVRNWEISKDQEIYERVMSPKFVKYYETHPLLPENIAKKLNNISLVIRHGVGVEVKLQFWLSIYMVQ